MQRAVSLLSLVGVMCAPMIVACNSSRDTTEAPTVAFTRTDSAGVEIVHYQSLNTSALEHWEIGSTPLTHIGDDAKGPEHQFVQVTGVVRMPDGRVIVAVDGIEMLAFDSSGNFLSRLARKGRGPGEFTSLSSLHRVRGDSLLAYQYRPETVSMFSPDGAFVRSELVSRPPADAELPSFEYQSAFHDGTLLVHRHGGEREIEPGVIYSDSIAPLRIAGNGALLAKYGTFWRADNTRAPAVGTVSGVPVPGNLTSFPHSPRRATWGAVRNEMFYSSWDSFNIEFRSSNGALRRIVRADVPMVSRSPADRTEITFGGVRFDLAATAPQRQPVVRSAFADANGNLWLGVHTRAFSDTTIRFIVLDSSGVVRAAVRWPMLAAQTSPWRFIANWRFSDDKTFTTAALDEDDRQHVLTFPITKSVSRSPQP